VVRPDGAEYPSGTAFNVPATLTLPATLKGVPAMAQQPDLPDDDGLCGGRWFRLNTTWSQSEWLAALPPAARLAWVEVLGHVKAHGFDGRVRAVAPAVFGRMVGIDAADVRLLLDAACADGAMVCADGEWTVSGWQRHQGDPTGKDRIRRYRDRQVKRDVTGVTRYDRYVTATETETETETEKEKHPSGAKRKRACRLPDDWAPTPAHAGQAAVLHLDLDLEADKLRDWATAKGETRVDWDATFRNWLRNAHPPADNGHRRAGIQNGLSAADRRIINYRKHIESVDLNSGGLFHD
jgi:hypothetical protein